MRMFVDNTSLAVSVVPNVPKTACGRERLGGGCFVIYLSKKDKFGSASNGASFKHALDPYYKVLLSELMQKCTADSAFCFFSVVMEVSSPG